MCRCASSVDRECSKGSRGSCCNESTLHGKCSFHSRRVVANVRFVAFNLVELLLFYLVKSCAVMCIFVSFCNLPSLGIACH